MQKFKKNFTIDYYSGLKGIYFKKILITIIRLGELDRPDIRILDFGCGTGRLSELLPGKVIGYDINPKLSEIGDWRKALFDVVVSNQVFEYFTASELSSFLTELRLINPDVELIVGTSRQRMLNAILAYLAGESDAHADAKLRPNEELELLKGHFEVQSRANVFQLCDIYRMRSKAP